MRGSLGEKIGEGAFADIYVWAPGQVVKLFKAGVPQRASWWVARMTRAVFAAGGRAPSMRPQSEYARLAGMSPNGADGGGGALPADRPRLRPPRRDGACSTGAADPAYRRGPVLVGLSFFSRAPEAEGPVEATSQCPLGVKAAFASRFDRPLIGPQLLQLRA